VIASRQTASTPVAGGSPERFGYEWSVYPDLRPEYERQFRGWTAHLKPSDWRGRTFLDVGCGMGRNSYWPMTYGAAGGVAVDVDARSLGAARANLSRYSSVSVEQRSAYDLGYQDRFDIVFSIGVVHHLEFPEKALTEMVRAAKPGGKVLIWVYGLENNRWIVRVVNPLRRALFSRMPVGVVHHLSLYPTMLLWAALRLGLGRLEYMSLLRPLHFPHIRSIVFDQLLPRITNYWTRERVEQLMSDTKLEQVSLIHVNEISWSVIGTKQMTEGC
jgi:SAM-dependent methyltransferase